ncbi:hypothetical protein GIB67_013039 [Kingdonia uniflora]|uniref:Uncharacterized protein n=1 Tax=Kingdonia uniflora TaxID=39325 RepID=A0A7J7MCM3_9MAGN|nr:hypothetical protein GIB67_013039 [Kingdonia uniflora]
MTSLIDWLIHVREGVEKKYGVSFAKEREARAYMTGPDHGIHPLANAAGKGLKTHLREAYEERVQSKMMSLQTRYFGNQSLSLSTPIPVPPTFHRITLEEVEEAEDDYHQMWLFHYMVLFATHPQACLQMLVEDAVATEDEKAGKSSEKYCRYPGKDLGVVMVEVVLRLQWLRRWWGLQRSGGINFVLYLTPVPFLRL